LRVNVAPGSDRPSGTTKRLWRSNFSVAVPLCGGIAITTLSAPALEISTSQNWRALFAPRPRSDEHVTAVVVRRVGLVPRCGSASRIAALTKPTTASVNPKRIPSEYNERSQVPKDTRVRNNRSGRSADRRSIVATYPTRIVCLTEETTETLYRLGAGDLVVGVSGYTARPPEARQKPRVSAFINANLDKITALRPDLVFAFSDLQADIVAALIRRGLTVVTFNQRSVAEILQMIRMVGGLVGLADRAEALAATLESDLDAIRESAAQLPWRPRVYFEEWDEPLISGIRWVDELIEIAGGTPVFPHLRQFSLGKDRIILPDAVEAAAPDVIVASWCGKKVRKSRIAERPGWSDMPAVEDGHIYEIKSTYILQPGPAALTEGVRQLHYLICHAAGVTPAPELAPEERVDPDAVTPGNQHTEVTGENGG